MSAAEAEFNQFLQHARQDPNIVGVVLVGSRGIGALVTPESDFDAYVVLRDPSLINEYTQRFPSSHGDAVEYIIVSIDSFRAHAMPGTPTRWDAYTFAHVEPIVDKLDGEIGETLRLKTLPEEDDARSFLGGYVNL